MTVKHDVQILLILLKLIFQFCWFSLTIWVGSSFCRILRKYSNIHTTASSFGDTSVVDIKTVEVQISIPWTRNHRTVWPFTCCSPQHPSSLSSFRVVQTTRHQSPPASSSSLVMAGWHRCRACHSTDLPRLAFLSPIKRWVNDGEARRREGVMDSYSMHNNWERLSTCITPSTPSQLSHLRPAERHKHTQIFTKTEGWLQAAIWAHHQSRRKGEKNHTLMYKTSAHKGKVTEMTCSNKASYLLTDIPKKACWHECTITLSGWKKYTIELLWQNSETLAGIVLLITWRYPQTLKRA